MRPNVYIVMGITGSGKSTIGAALARSLGVDFIEGDDYHPLENVRKMSLGIPLTDDDRAGWLHALAYRISEAREEGARIVVSCSALKRSYRDVLRSADRGMQFVFLRGSRSMIEQRLGSRRGHFMPASPSSTASWRRSKHPGLTRMRLCATSASHRSRSSRT
jgi:carbohydrate kinase, thermoresistant glucokinase family